MLEKWLKSIMVTLVTAILFNTIGGPFYSLNDVNPKVIKIKTDTRVYNYDNYFDILTVEELKNDEYTIATSKKINKNLLSGIKFTNSITEIKQEESIELGELKEAINNEEIEISSVVKYSPEKEQMTINLSITNEDGSNEQIKAYAKPIINTDGSISGSLYINGEYFNLKEVMEDVENSEINDCFVLSAVTISIIVGAIIGGTIGGVGAYRAAKAKKLTTNGTIIYVVGGVTIGSVVGGALGAIAGKTGAYIFPKLQSLGTGITTKTGFKSFPIFKTTMGSAGVGYQWHHIISQKATNIAKYGNELIHNTKNIVRIPEKLHYQVTAHYNSTFKGAYDGLTFGEWLSRQDYNTQYREGMKVLLELAEKHGHKIIFN